MKQIKIKQKFNLNFIFHLLIICLLFSACSNQIDTNVRTGNEGFIIGNGSNAVLLAHGLSSSPYEVKALADYLSERNLTVYAVRLPGHGTNIEDLSRTEWESWYESYKEAYLSLKETHSNVYVGGMSLGGVLALRLSEEENVSGVIALAPALILDDSRSNYAWLFKYFSKYSSRNLSSDTLPYNYDKFSIASVAEAVSLSKITKKDLNKITAPIFLMQYKQDYRVKPQSSQIVYDSVNSFQKELIWIEGNGHVMINVPEREEYFSKIYQFIQLN